jgi:hypothetical protein
MGWDERENLAVSTSAIEMAFSLARTGKFENYTEVKRVLRGNFVVERELFGRQLAVEVTRVCKEARAQSAEDRSAAPARPTNTSLSQAD